MLKRVFTRMLPVLALFVANQLVIEKARAGDAPVDLRGTMPDPATSYYGNVHLTSGSDADPAFTKLVGMVNAGGKFAYEGGVGQIGYQADADIWYNDLSWSYPANTAFSGNSGELDGALHLTYQLDDRKKLGLFVSYSDFSNQLSETNGTLLPGGFQSIGSNMGITGLGVEGLWAFGSGTTVQLRSAAVTRVFNTTTTDTGTGPTTTGGFQFNLADYGAVVALGANQHLGDNWSLHGDLGVMNMILGSTSSTELAWGAVGGVDYTFDGMPISLGVQGGYESIDFNGTTTNAITTSTKLTYSFGGPSSGARGKLFRSGLLNFFF